MPAQLAQRRVDILSTYWLASTHTMQSCSSFCTSRAQLYQRLNDCPADTGILTCSKVHISNTAARPLFMLCSWTVCRRRG